jgi:hypothetical protein
MCGTATFGFAKDPEEIRKLHVFQNPAARSVTIRLLWHDKGTNYGCVADSAKRRVGPFATSRFNGNYCL